MNLAILTDELIRDEGLRLKAYKCTAGKTTIGVGRNLDDLGISETEARYLLQNDILLVCAELDKALPWWRTLSWGRQHALINLSFNLGLVRLLGFKKMLTAMQMGQWVEAAAHALDSQWAKQVGARSQRIAAAIREG